ncbi:Uncharacterised protein [Yersinia frederiksenii]|nr:Uncharacterised protein [Yersinia frederiksenii]
MCDEVDQAKASNYTQLKSVSLTENQQWHSPDSATSQSVASQSLAACSVTKDVVMTSKSMSAGKGDRHDGILQRD